MRIHGVRLFIDLMAVLLFLSVLGIVRADEDPSTSCLRDVALKPALSQIRGKLPLDMGKISFAMLANDAVPTPQERNKIAEWLDDRDECLKVGDSYRRNQYGPAVYAQRLATHTAVLDTGVDLYKGRITYGQANKRIAAAIADYSVKVAGITQYKSGSAAPQPLAPASQAQVAQVQRPISDRDTVADEQRRIRERDAAMTAQAQDQQQPQVSAGTSRFNQFLQNLQALPLAQYKSKCAGFGFSEGTPQFAQCVQREFDEAHSQQSVTCFGASNIIRCQ